MFVARLLILLLVVAALMWLLKRLFSGSAELEKPDDPKSENMLQCKYCGVHVPESSAITVNDEPYCSREHAELDQQ